MREDERMRIAIGFVVSSPLHGERLRERERLKIAVRLTFDISESC